MLLSESVTCPVVSCSAVISPEDPSRVRPERISFPERISVVEISCSWPGSIPITMLFPLTNCAVVPWLLVEGTNMTFARKLSSTCNELKSKLVNCKPSSWIWTPPMTWIVSGGTDVDGFSVSTMVWTPRSSCLCWFSALISLRVWTEGRIVCCPCRCCGVRKSVSWPVREELGFAVITPKWFPCLKCDWMWDFRCPEVRKFLVHFGKGHWYGFRSKCSRRCTRKLKSSNKYKVILS